MEYFLEKQHYCPFTVSVLIDDNFVGIFINWSYLGICCFFFFFSLSLTCHETLKVVGINSSQWDRCRGHVGINSSRWDRCRGHIGVNSSRWDRCKGTRVLLPASLSPASNLIY